MSIDLLLRIERARSNAGVLAPIASRDELRARLQNIENEVSSDPSRCFSFDSHGNATLRTLHRTFRAGQFDTPSIAELRARIPKHTTRGMVRLSALSGVDPLTDIGMLQATAGPGSLFQVASQFNCLESPGAYLVKVSEYLDDPTQGPRASISAFPGTFLRHYAVPAKDGHRFTQTEKHQVNLLSDAFDKKSAEVQSGYLTTSQIADLAGLVSSLTKNFEKIKVGLHDHVQVVYGYNWGGPSPEGQEISQVFTSTLALGGYSSAPQTEALTEVSRHLLRAAYLGTLLSALSLRKQLVVLTLIGGGVFGNPLPLIWESILWAQKEAEAIAPYELEVLVNVRQFSEALPRETVYQDVISRRGVLLEVDGGKITLTR